MKRTILCTIGVMVLAACGSKNDEVRVDKDSLIERISGIEQTVSERWATYSDDTASLMVELYTRFVSHFPEDSLTPIYMMRMADIEVNRGNFEEGVALYDSAIEFSGFDYRADCMLRKAEALDQEGEHGEEAIAAYRDFVSQYPEHPMSKEIAGRLKYAKMTQEELVDAVHEMEKRQRP